MIRRHALPAIFLLLVSANAIQGGLLPGLDFGDDPALGTGNIISTAVDGFSRYAGDFGSRNILPRIPFLNRFIPGEGSSPLGHIFPGGGSSPLGHIFPGGGSSPLGNIFPGGGFSPLGRLFLGGGSSPLGSIFSGGGSSPLGRIFSVLPTNSLIANPGSANAVASASAASSTSNDGSAISK